MPPSSCWGTHDQASLPATALSLALLAGCGTAAPPGPPAPAKSPRREDPVPGRVGDLSPGAASALRSLLGCLALLAPGRLTAG